MKLQSPFFLHLANTVNLIVMCPEVKVFLDGSEVIVITKGFSEKDMKTIGDIIFNGPRTGEISNDEYLEKIWEDLHGKSKKS